jgi:hypothetical protein
MVMEATDRGLVFACVQVPEVKIFGHDSKKIKISFPSKLKGILNSGTAYYGSVQSSHRQYKNQNIKVCKATIVCEISGSQGGGYDNLGYSDT